MGNEQTMIYTIFASNKQDQVDTETLHNQKSKPE